MGSVDPLQLLHFQSYSYWAYKKLLKKCWVLLVKDFRPPSFPLCAKNSFRGILSWHFVVQLARLQDFKQGCNSKVWPRHLPVSRQISETIQQPVLHPQGIWAFQISFLTWRLVGGWVVGWFGGWLGGNQVDKLDPSVAKIMPLCGPTCKIARFQAGLKFPSWTRVQISFLT